MKRRTPNAFTLIEMITVVAIIVVLAGLVISVAGLVQNKAGRSRAEAEIKAITGACNAYNNDNGTYPKSDDTNALDPRVDVSPTSSKYQKSSLYLYSCLSGDLTFKGRPASGQTTYFSFNRQQINFTKDSAGNIVTVLYIQDPFGNAYGYSTAANEVELAYREDVRKDPTTPRPTASKGYNPTFDLWSTAGGTTTSQVAKWVKNWGE